MSEKFGTSQPVRRREDVRLLTGRGEYVDDRDESGYLHAAFLRSPVAHGRIRSVDIDAALAAPGVVDVFTGADLKAAGLGGIHARPPLPGTEMDPPIHTPRPGMAADIVRHVGEPVAVVIAQTRRQAKTPSNWSRPISRSFRPLSKYPMRLPMAPRLSGPTWPPTMWALLEKGRHRRR